MSGWRRSTWGTEVSLEYGKAIRDYQDASKPFRVYGTNGPVGWTDKPLTFGPGVILGRKGAYRGVHFSPDPFFVIDTAYYVRPKSPDLDMRWLYYAAHHHKLGEIDDGSPVPSTTRSAVYVRDLDVPPPAEQRAISATLGALDDKIDLNRRMNETLEAMARALFRDWFVDFGPTRARMAGRAPTLADDLWRLFPDRLDDQGQPSGWQRECLERSFHLVMGQSPPGETYNEAGQGLPFFQGRTDFGFRYPRRRVYCTAPTRVANEGDTLISVRAPVGALNVAAETSCLGRGVAALRHKAGAMTFTHYTAWSLQDRLRAFDSEGTVFGAINKKQFENLPVTNPGDQLVWAFEAAASAFDRKIKANEAESRILEHSRDELLPRLLSGEVSLRGPATFGGVGP